MYKNVVIKNSFSAKKQAENMENTIRNYEKDGWTFVNAIPSSFFRIILTFKKDSVVKPVVAEEPKFDKKFFKVKTNHVVENMKN